MPNEENQVADKIRDTIVAISSSYNKRNVLVVPEYIPPPGRWTDVMVQVHHPISESYGQGGGAYLNRLTVPVGVFARAAADPKSEYEGLVTKVIVASRAIRVALTDYDCAVGADSLSIPLYDNNHQRQARLLEVEGDSLKEVIWVPLQFWGVWCQTTAEFTT